MSVDDDVTIGELSRTMHALDRRIGEQFAAVNRRLDSLQFVNRETYEVQMKMIVERLEALEDARRWTIRTFVAAFVFPLLVGLALAVAVTQ